ncbi:hypothetical protein A0O36_02763 [Piscirickettsiaceae bacterium NZ-RLO1]|nr:hypothetical protein A0O36_02763 [Piscirickettsiaceae bacterium NZ-RLO1]
MQQWASGYPSPAIQSSIDTPSPAHIDHQPKLFCEPTTLFFNMSNIKCKEMRQAILDSHFN